MDERQDEACGVLVGEGFASLLGEKLRARRLEAGVGLRVLARDLGVSASLISQIEHGKSSPSVATLYAIATRLDISLDELFQTGDAAPSPGPDEEGANGRPSRWQAPSEGPVLRADNRLRLTLATGVHWERLTATDDPHLDFVLCTYPVGGESAPADELMVHGGAEYGLVLQGRCGATVGDDTWELTSGDSITFDARTPHRIANIGNEPMISIWVVVGRDNDPRLST
ncbi:MAG: helix-turn-helix transcriptional regulator [Actinobacteria bacterium]|nr:helix-turn-helix transcriptional regulator [Actinomycetota bacterium]